MVAVGLALDFVAMTGSGDPGDGIPRPAVVLYPPEKVQLEWKHPRHIGVGLRNNNNNCYVNSILQCLTYTAPLVNYLYSNEHTYKCKSAVPDFRGSYYWVKKGQGSDYWSTITSFSLEDPLVYHSLHDFLLLNFRRFLFFYTV